MVYAAVRLSLSKTYFKKWTLFTFKTRDVCLQVYLFAEALAEGAVKMGMPSTLAHSIASQTVLVSFTAI